MILDEVARGLGDGAFPRTRGDDPRFRDFCITVYIFSPHPRG